MNTCDIIPPNGGSISATFRDSLSDLCETGGVESDREELLSYKLSKRRWLILAAITIFGFLNGLVNELNAILATMVDLLDISLNKFLYFSQAFSLIAPAFALPTAWLVDRYGLRSAVMLSLLLVTARDGSRALLFLPQTANWKELRFFYWTISLCSSAQVASIYWCLPLKISESWFSVKERSFAWSCMSAAPILGSALSSFWTPWVVKTTNSTQLLAYTNLVALITILTSICLCIHRSEPKEAPSARQLSKASNSEQKSLWENIKCLLINKDILLFVIATNSFESGEMAIKNVLQNLLAASGFTQTFCGDLLAIVAIVSAILQLSSALIEPDKSHETGNSAKCKLYLTIQWLTFALYSLTLIIKHQNHQYWLMISSSLLYTVCRFWAAPAYKNQIAHLIVGSVSEATVSAAGTVAGYLLTTLFTVIVVHFRQVDPLEPKHSSNYNNSILSLFALISLSSFLYLTCFSGRKFGDCELKSKNMDRVSSIIVGPSEQQGGQSVQVNQSPVT